MYYFLITLAALMFSSQFIFNQGFQKESVGGWNAAVKMSFYTSLFGIIVTFIINKFQIHFSVFSLLVSLVCGFVFIALGYCTIKVYEYSTLSAFSVFSMIGGMVIPFIYGVIIGEEMTVSKIICLALITLSILLMLDKRGNSKKAIPYCLGVFFLNGLGGVISKFHQSYTDLAVDSASFLMLSRFVILVFSALLMIKTKDFKISKKSALYLGGSSALNSVANLILLIALFHLPASVQYPIVTGGTIVFSTLFDLIKKEPVSKKVLIATAISCVATVVMAF